MALASRPARQGSSACWPGFQAKDCVDRYIYPGLRLAPGRHARLISPCAQLTQDQDDGLTLAGTPPWRSA